MNELVPNEREDDSEDDDVDDGKNRSRSRSSSAINPFRSAEASSMPSACRSCSFSCSSRLISVSRSVAQSKSVMYERRASSGVGEDSEPGDGGCSPAIERIRARRFWDRRRREMEVFVEPESSACKDVVSCV